MAEESKGDKPLHCIGSSRKDICKMPEDVKDIFGFALRKTQSGDKHPDAKVMKGFGGAGVLGVVADEEGNTYRAIYTVKFPSAVYTLHVFQKKSKRGIETPKEEIRLVKNRLEMAKEHHKEHYEQKKTRRPDKKSGFNKQVEDSTGNVFEDMGLPDAETRLAKAHLAQRISQLIKAQKLSQMEAAEKLGIDQPKISALVRGKLKDFSTERLMRFITALDQDVIITIRKPRDSAHSGGRMLVEV